MALIRTSKTTPVSGYTFIDAKGYNSVASFTFNTNYNAGDYFIVTADSVSKLPSTVSGFTVESFTNGIKLTASQSGSSVFIQLNSSGGGGITHLRPL